jgi:hypothetical protein
LFLKLQVFWDVTLRRPKHIYQSIRRNIPEGFSLWVVGLIKTTGNETTIISTSGFWPHGNEPSGCTKAKELHDYLTYYQFRKKTAVVCFDHSQSEYISGQINENLQEDIFCKTINC